jgi:hypothetical protein
MNRSLSAAASIGALGAIVIASIRGSERGTAKVARTGQS